MIYTFYSTEHQTGRSMALANLAEFFYKRGLKVLIVDWDLQKPSLENYFPLDQDQVNQCPGVIDMLLDYKKNMTRPFTGSESEEQGFPLGAITPYLIKIYPSQRESGEIFLLPAGRRMGRSAYEYSTLTKGFDLDDFINNWEGKLFFDWLKYQFSQIADVILIDSPAGDTALLSSCTSYFADTVLLFCTQWHRSLDNTLLVARSLAEEPLENRKGRQLNLLVIPARIELAEAALLSKFRSRIRTDFMSLMPTKLLHEFEEDLFAMLEIPYIPYYSFPDKLALREEDGKAIGWGMATAFYKIGDVLTRLTTDDDMYLHQNNTVDIDHLLQCFRQLREHMTETATIFISYAHENQDIVQKIYDKLLMAGFKPWLDKEDLLPGQDWRAVIEDRIEKSDFVIVCLSNQSIYKRGFVQKEIVWSLDIVESMPEGDVYLIPIRLEDCEVPRRLSRWQWLDIFEENGFDKLEKSIRLALRSRKNRNTASTSA